MARELAARFDELRAAALRVVDGLGEADMSRSARHPRHGPVTLALLLQYWAGHDLMHSVQAERALMQPFIEASGPWRTEFADHDAAIARGSDREGEP